MFLRRDVAKNRRVPQRAIQTITLSYASTITIPPLVRTFYSHGLVYAGGVDGISPYGEMQIPQIEFLSSNKYLGTSIIYTLQQNTMSFKNVTSAPASVMLQAAFTDPIQVMCDFQSVTSDAEDLDYPMPEDMIQGITLGLLSGEFKLISPATEDFDNLTNK